MDYSIFFTMDVRKPLKAVHYSKRQMVNSGGLSDSKLRFGLTSSTQVSNRQLNFITASLI